MMKVSFILMVVFATVYTATVDHFQQDQKEIYLEGETYGQDEKAVEGDETNVDDVGRDIEVNRLGLSSNRCPYDMKYWSVQNHCFSFSEDELSWYDAVTVCELVTKVSDNSQNGWLGHIFDQRELNFYTANTCGNQEYWIGGTDLLKHGNFEWYHWRIINKWYGSCKPSAKAYAECIYIQGGRLKAGNCSEKRRYICERRA